MPSNCQLSVCNEQCSDSKWPCHTKVHTWFLTAYLESTPRGGYTYTSGGMGSTRGEFPPLRLLNCTHSRVIPSCSWDKYRIEASYIFIDWIPVSRAKSIQLVITSVWPLTENMQVNMPHQYRGSREGLVIPASGVTESIVNIRSTGWMAL